MKSKTSVPQTLSTVMSPPRSNPLRLIRLSEVMRQTGLRKTTIYQLQSGGEFPQRVQITVNCVGWIESEIQAWLEARAGGRPVLPQAHALPATPRHAAAASR